MTALNPTDLHASTPQLPLEDGLALSLGRMMLRFAALEAITRHTLHRVLDLNDEDHRQVLALVAGLPFRKVRDALLAAVRDQRGEDETWKALRIITRRASKVEERRNVLTHSFWIYSELPTEMKREKQHISGAGAFRNDAEVFRDVAELQSFVTEIDAVTDALTWWFIGQFLGCRRAAT